MTLRLLEQRWDWQVREGMYWLMAFCHNFGKNSQSIYHLVPQQRCFALLDTTSWYLIFGKYWQRNCGKPGVGFTNHQFARFHLCCASPLLRFTFLPWPMAFLASQSYLKYWQCLMPLENGSEQQESRQGALRLQEEWRLYWRESRGSPPSSRTGAQVYSNTWEKRASIQHYFNVWQLCSHWLQPLKLLF